MSAAIRAIGLHRLLCRPGEDPRLCALRLLGWLQFVVAVACIAVLLWLFRLPRERERAADLIAGDVASFALGALAVLRYHAVRCWRERAA